jgi:putative flavoprotein involved in K+ transport
MAADGVVVVGRTLGAANGRVSFADDAETVLRAADEAFDGFVALAGSKTADDLGEIVGEEVSEDADPNGRSRPVVEPRETLDLSATGVATVVWATGYAYDYHWLRLPVFDDRGRPNQQRGVTALPGLYFLGLHWMHTFRSGLLSGVGDDAHYLADRM